MRIPLDYYRILGVPIQASAEQLQQAYGDRILQLPRREYSEMAIAARKQLIDEAYAILRDPEQRRAYDTSFLSNSYDRGLLNSTSTYPPDAIDTSAEEKLESTTPTPSIPLPLGSYPAPTIDIAEDELIGALLILQELGEYEIVLKIGRPYLNNDNPQIDNGRFGDPKIIRQDTVLTFALACLELGREQWQQRRYEDASNSLNEGQELLLREGIFASVRGEIQADLDRLRPYRILELVALPEEKLLERRQGLQILREMLQERGGMDGTGDDRSGLNIDDFLRFIQQLRPYLTSAEQQLIFEEEARRPSAVATYLAVYALLARGFAQRQPLLIRRAKQMLMRLGKRQDVHLEQAVCALLMGQTLEASSALEYSGEYQSLAFIREHSQGAEDLLPGLCLYSERWLQSEVFPHFRDLANQPISLKEYFADEQLQSSLETLPAIDDSNDWEVIGSQRVAPPQSTTSSSRRANTAPALGMELETDPVQGLRTQMERTKAIIESHSEQESAVSTGAIPQNMPNAERILARISIPTTLQNPPTNLQTLPVAEREDLEIPGEETSEALLGDTPNAGRSSKRTTDPNEVGPRSKRFPNQPARKSSGKRRNQRTTIWSKLNPSNWSIAGRSSSGENADNSRTAKQIPLGWLLMGFLGIGVSLFLLVWIVNSLLSKPTSPAPSPVAKVEVPPPPTPKDDTSLLKKAGPISSEVAAQAIETWFSAKAKALGQDHDADSLKEILVNPALSRWQTLARDAKKANWYREYKHEVKTDSIKIRQISTDRARVEAQVSESAQHFQNNKLIQKESYDSNLQVRYDLVRQNGQWRIQNMKVI